MHRITLPTYFAPLNLQPGDYYADDQIAAGIMSNRRGVTLTHCDPPTGYQFSFRNETLFARAGGFGDLLLMTPMFRELKRIDPARKITVATLPNYGDALKHLTTVDEVITMPTPADTMGNFAKLIWCESVIEGPDADHSRHAVDLFAELAGVTVTDRRLDYVVTESEKAEATSRFPRVAGKKRVGIQVDASSPNRCYPREQLAEAAQYLVQRGCEVFLFGAPGSVTGGMPGVVNLTQIPSAPDFRESAAIMATCDCVVTPDSAALHLCSALNIPCVALFAAFDPQTRVTSDKCFVLRGVGECVGCSFHSCGFDQWPEGKPCYKAGQCIPLAEIPPERIGAKVMQLLG